MTHPKGKYAWTVKIGEKGQFVIPKEARDIFGIKPGDTLIVLGDVERGIAIPPQRDFHTTGGTCFLRCQRRQVISSALFDAKKTSNSTCSFLFKKTSDSGGVFQ